MPISDEQRAANDKRVTEDVREYGCHVISVFDPEEKRPNFSYSVGIFETSGVPEALVVGLSPELGGSIVNAYNRQVRAGAEFQRGKLYEGLLKVSLYTSNLPTPISLRNTLLAATGTTRELPTRWCRSSGRQRQVFGRGRAKPPSGSEPISQC